MLRTVFMGSPEFAVASLQRVQQETQLLGVFTQPDKPRARGNRLLPTPVKSAALAMGLPVYEPQRIRDQEVIELLRQLNPDVILVVAYAKLIPKVILDLPRFGCINVHPSLLPRYRGAIPIQASLMQGDSETGVCTFFMDEGYDTGDLIFCQRTPIGPDETGEQLSQRLALLGAQVLSRTVAALASDEAPRQPQPKEAEGGYTKPLSKSDLVIDWTWRAERIANFVRALAHEPGAGLAGIGLKLGRVTPWEGHSEKAPGTIMEAVRGQGFTVQTGAGLLLVEEVKPPGKNWMSAWSFWQGKSLEVGQVLASATLAAPV